MMAPHILICKTDRLQLRKFSLDDAPFLLRLLNEESFIRNIGDRNVRGLDDARNYISEKLIASYERYGWGLYLTVLKETKTPIGMCGLVKRDFLPQPDMGFALLPDFCGMGYAFEASMAILYHAENQLALPELLAITNPDNDKSCALLEKLGFIFTKQVRPPDENKDLKLYRWGKPVTKSH